MLIDETLRLVGWLIPSRNLNCGSGRNSTSLELGNKGELGDIEKKEVSEGESWGVEEVQVINDMYRGWAWREAIVKYTNQSCVVSDFKKPLQHTLLSVHGKRSLSWL